MIGAFIPWNDSPRSTRSVYIGYVIDGNGCHIWTGCKQGSGYGFVSVGGGRCRSVHRVRYEREIGPIPDGMQLDHFVCNNRACCNPLHVRPVSVRENVLRSETSKAATNRAKTHCPQGHPLTGDNVYVRPEGRGCLTCRRATSARWNEKKKLGA